MRIVKEYPDSVRYRLDELARTEMELLKLYISHNERYEHLSQSEKEDCIMEFFNTDDYKLIQKERLLLMNENLEIRISEIKKKLTEH